MTKSDELVRDFYKGQAKRYKLLVFGLVCILLLNIAGLFYLRAEQRRSNRNIENIANTISNDIDGREERLKERDESLQAQHERLYKAVLCVIALHDSSALNAETSAECERSLNDMNNMSSTITPVTSQPSPQATQEPPDSPSAPSTSNPPSSSPGPLQSLWQIITQPVSDILSLVRR